MKTRLVVLALGMAASSLRAETLTIQNESLRLDYDTSTWHWSATDISADAGTAHIALKQLVSSVGGAGVKTTVQDPVFGQGQEIVIKDNRGESTTMELFPGLPFALLRVALTASTSADEAGQIFPTQNAPVAGFVPDLDVPWDKLVVRGTGGLHATSDYAPRTRTWLQAIWDKLMRRHDRAPAASYEWLAVADPATRHGIVAGFITQDRATGVLNPVVDKNSFRVQTRSEFGNLPVRMAVDGGPPYEAETLAVGCFADVHAGLEAYADALARAHHVQLKPELAGFTTWYMEKNGGAPDEKTLATLSDFIGKNLKPCGMSFLQLDDRWQLGAETGNGPDKNFTESNPKVYPAGMKAVADQMRADGLTPGLWFLPFAGAYQDPWFADKQALFVNTREGKPLDTGWGGTCLDMTHPAAQDYVRGIVANITQNWGFSYLKIDGLYTGLGVQNVYINSDYNPADGFGDAVFADKTKTPVEAFRAGLQLVRDTAGPNVFILGCNTAQNMRVFGASMGLVDAMRIGPDNAREVSSATSALNVGPPPIVVDWKSWRDVSPVYGAREYFLNGHVWWNDPDPTYVRASLTLDEARTEASWTAIAGQLFTGSDWLPDLPPERLDILKRTCTPHGGTARPVDFLESDPPRVWQLTDGTGDARRDVIGLFNFDDAPATITVPLDRLDLPKAGSYAAFDYWANQFLPPLKDTITATLAPHACQIIALRPMLDHPVVIGTSRNVEQGMTDLTDEKWDAKTRTLSGKAIVVGGEPSELRIVLPGSPGTWAVQGSNELPLAFNGNFQSSDPSREMIVGTSGPGLRATLHWPDSQPLTWSITFK